MKKIYIKSTFEVDVTEEELKEITESPSWQLLAILMNRAKPYSVPEVIIDNNERR